MSAPESERFSPLGWEAPYQVALVVSVLEALSVLALYPSDVGSPPLLYQGIVGVRAATMVGLGVLVRNAAPRSAWPALLAWAAMTLAPELWAHAVQAAEPSPLLPAIGSLAYGLAAHSLSRLARPAWPLVAVAAAASALLLPGAYGPYGQLLGEGVPFWLLGAILVAGGTAIREEGRS